MIRRIELIAHAGAASTRQDDERYRAQAEAYASFNAAVKIPLGGVAPANNDVDEQLLHENARLKASSMGNPAAQLYLDDTQFAYTAVDSQLLTSSLRQLQYESISQTSQARELPPSPAIRKRKRESELDAVAHSNSSLDVEDETRLNANTALPTRESPAAANGSITSSYLKSPELNRATKKTKLDVHRARVSSEPIISDRAHRVPVTSAGAHQAVRLTQPAGNIAEQDRDSASGEQSTSELPTSYSLSDITSESSKVRPNVSQRSTSDPGPQIGSISPTALRPVPTPRKLHLQDKPLRVGSSAVENFQKHEASKHEARSSARLTADLPSANAQSSQTYLRKAAASAAPARPHSTTQEPEKRGDQHCLVTSKEDLHTLQELSVSIRAPQTRAAVAEFETHVTEPLSFLADNVDVNKAYSPISVARDLRPLERGHWLLKCPEHSGAWPLHDQIEFWRYLEKTIGKGNAGWGVWCARNDEAMTVDVDRTSLGPVKVFCWGEIVRHVYLLLYVASRSKVKKLGLQWIDAEGLVIVQMRKG